MFGAMLSFWSVLGGDLQNWTMAASCQLFTGCKSAQ